MLKEQSGSTEVTALADMISGTSLPAPAPRADQLQSDADTDTVEEGNGKTNGATGVQKPGSSGSASKDANKA